MQQRETNLIKLARAIYESALAQKDAQQLELLRHVTVAAKQVFDDMYNENHLLHPDLGMELLLFIELKSNNEPEAETDRLEFLRILEGLENRLSIQ